MKFESSPALPPLSICRSIHPSMPASTSLSSIFPSSHLKIPKNLRCQGQKFLNANVKSNIDDSNARQVSHNVPPARRRPSKESVTPPPPAHGSCHSPAVICKLFEILLGYVDLRDAFEMQKPRLEFLLKNKIHINRSRVCGRGGERGGAHTRK